MRLILPKTQQERNSPTYPFKERGFTLVELLLAVGLFGIVIGSVLAGLTHANYHTAWASYNDVASKLAEQRLEEIANAQWDPSAQPAIDEVVTNNFPNDTVRLDLNTTSGSQFTGSRTVQITTLPSTSSPQYKVITAQVVWSFRGHGPFTNNMVTIRAMDQ